MSIPSTLSETALYRRLQELVDEPYQLEAGQKNRRAALALVDAITSEAAALMGRAPVRFPEYTLHDEVHLRRVAHLMGVILKESGALQRISYLEITILLLAAYLHDVGMVPSEDRVTEILDSDAFALFRAGKRDERAVLRELEALLVDMPSGSPAHARYRRKAGEIELGILTEYLRVSHGEAGWAWIRARYGDDPRWVLEGQNVADLVAWVCRGHAFHPHQLTAEYRVYFPLEKLVGQTPVNVLYCTLVLRLADILDFDRERTPVVLYDNISPRNEVSLQEWNKHRSITGWKISHDRIVFEAECTHPAYEKALREFLDAIDAELQASINIVRTFPHNQGIAEQYRLTLPPVVDRGRIRAKDDAYSYVDLAFTLSHQDIMKLLMGQDFWGGPSLAVRELIQNAYDAIRHRQALERAAGNEWNKGKIVLRQRVNEEGRLELSCEDNGIGMTRHLLEKYFFRVGKSYYRSPEFERERAGLKGKGADFDPISQFGLGVVSTFMIGDRLRVQTQRYLGPHLGCGEAIEVDVEGTGRLVVMRTVPRPIPAPGTRIVVVGAEVSQALSTDAEFDPISLLRQVQVYASALDVPVEVHVEEPFSPVHQVLDPAPRPLRLETDLERLLPADAVRVFERDLGEGFPQSEGTLRMAFLVDDEGRIAIENQAARWKPDQSLFSNNLTKPDGSPLARYVAMRDTLLAQDGITVVSHEPELTEPHVRELIPFMGTTLFANLRGTDKLPLHPNRSPYAWDRGLETPEEEAWGRFVRTLRERGASILEEILGDDRLRPAAEVLWSVILRYHFPLAYVSKQTAERHLPLPSRTRDGTVEWRTIEALQASGCRYLQLMPEAGFADPDVFPDVVTIPNMCVPLAQTEVVGHAVREVIRATTVLSMGPDGVRYRIDPATPFYALGTSILIKRGSTLHFQAYEPDLRDHLFVHSTLSGINIDNPAGGFLARHPAAPTLRRFRAGLGLLLDILVRNPDFPTEEPKRWSHWMRDQARGVVRQWEKVDWTAVPLELCPPYRVIGPRSATTVEISFESLRDAVESFGPEPPRRKR